MGGFSTNFFQKLIQIHKMWLKLPKIGNNWPIFKLFGYFHVFQVVEHIPDSLRMITFKKETFKKKIPKIEFLVTFSNFSNNL
jgi:hypothetical protein